MTAQLDLSASAYASLDGVAGRLDRHDGYLAGLSEGVTCPETPAIAFTGAQAAGGIGGAYVPPAWGPTLGFTWFVQLLTVGPLASGDTLAVYSGLSIFDNEGQRLKQQFIGTAGAWQPWYPPRTALRLKGGKQALVFDGGSGTLTSGTRYFVNVDVIQVADQYLAQFLLGSSR